MPRHASISVHRGSQYRTPHMDARLLTSPLEWKRLPASRPMTMRSPACSSASTAIRAGTAAELVWLVEHPPLYTAGTSARPDQLTDPSRFPDPHDRPWRPVDLSRPRPARGLRHAGPDRPHGRVPARDVRCYRARAGGMADPRARPLRRARRAARGPRRHLGRRPRPRPRRRSPLSGFASSRWVSWHGVALNVAPDLRHYGGIVPCGISEHGVTSLHALGIPATMEEADAALRAAWDEVFSADPDTAGSRNAPADRPDPPRC